MSDDIKIGWSNPNVILPPVDPRRIPGSPERNRAIAQRIAKRNKRHAKNRRANAKKR